ncbi:unnamed protein product [Bursaphelenchus okinawaensis]|uniref:PDZ domain-containing protein n=1 Tax=Bursaphelenchus okinawaensis TaxID=465554 RepID=A0A811LJT1_9BILA|nr:unnamed protein product [Bursaphelenchus okinawaensis]CAG9124549.1 unnamed protein product [Bursaphelenchus okinawaensis]
MAKAEKTVDSSLFFDDQSPYGKKLPANWCETVTVTLKGTKGQPLGCRFWNLVVSRLDSGGASECVFRYGDALRKMNGEPLVVNGRADADKFLKAFKAMQKADFSAELELIRPVLTQPVEEGRLKDELKQEGYTYKVVILYSIIGLKVGLTCRTADGKVYVCNVHEFTISSMSLSCGDVILDVNKTPISSSKEASELITSGLKSRAYVTLLVEQPEDLVQKAAVRAALVSASTDLDLGLAPDVIEICRKEEARLKKHPDMKPKKSALKTDAKSPKTNRIKFQEDSQDIPIVADRNPNLLMHVPTAPSTNNYQSLAALSNETKK